MTSHRHPPAAESVSDLEVRVDRCATEVAEPHRLQLARFSGQLHEVQVAVAIKQCSFCSPAGHTKKSALAPFHFLLPLGNSSTIIYGE